MSFASEDVLPISPFSDEQVSESEWIFDTMNCPADDCPPDARLPLFMLSADVPELDMPPLDIFPPDMLLDELPEPALFEASRLAKLP